MLTTLGPGSISQVPPAKPAASYPEQPTRTAPVSRGNYDSVDLSPAPDGERRQFLDLVSKIAKETRTATTIGDIQALRAQVSAGAYEPDAMAIAAKLLLMEDAPT